MQTLLKKTNIYLLPGEYFVGGEQYRIRTLLGSCVSITLWHPRMRIGAMSHFLLPARRDRNISRDTALNSRYGEEAMILMLRDLASLRVAAYECEAKIFGGGVMFSSKGANAASVGIKNGEAAERLLALHGIPVVSESLYGKGHRELIFDISNGDAWSRQVDPADIHRIQAKAAKT